MLESFLDWIIFEHSSFADNHFLLSDWFFGVPVFFVTGAIWILQDYQGIQANTQMLVSWCKFGNLFSICIASCLAMFMRSGKYG
jgi:hypothetical protein